MKLFSAGEALVDLVPDPRPGGGPMNVAVAAARLGADAAFVGRVSSDAYGDLLWEHLAGSGVDLRFAQRGDEPTALAVVEHDPTPRFRFDGEGTADTCLGPVDLSDAGPGPHLLHGGTLGLFRGTTASVLADLAESHDGLVSLDPNVRPQIIDDPARWRAFHDRWAAVATVYKGSDEDLSWIFPGRSPDDIAAELLDRGCVLVLVTRGAEGVVAHHPHGPVEVQAPKVDVVDTVGAGDSFVGAVLAELARRGIATRNGVAALGHADLEAILGFAVRVAAITCTRQGADPPTRAEVDAWAPA